jgi:hypothetical protein
LLATLFTTTMAAGERGPAAAHGRLLLLSRCEATGRRRGQDRTPNARARPASPGPVGLGVLGSRTGPRRSGGRGRGVGHGSDGPPDPRRDRLSTRDRGRRSSTPMPCSTRTPAPGCLGQRSPQLSSPPTPRAGAGGDRVQPDPYCLR